MSIILYFALTILVMCGIFLGIRRLDTQDLLPPIICSVSVGVIMVELSATVTNCTFPFSQMLLSRRTRDTGTSAVGL